MTISDRYREWYEHERDCNKKMLAMLESVPDPARHDPRYKRAVELADHLAACRENWLDRMTSGGVRQVDWWPQGASVDSLKKRYLGTEAAWKSYLAGVTDKDLEAAFEFHSADGNRYRWSIEGQIFQLVGHAYYHRGQISLLVQELGGQTGDTDYLYWAYTRYPGYGRV
jgi:uncharacterized damage-inducible protein DinB